MFWVNGNETIISTNSTKLGGFLNRAEGNKLGDFEEFILASDVNHDGRVDNEDKDLIAQCVSNKAKIDQNYYVPTIKDLQIIYNQ